MRKRPRLLLVGLAAAMMLVSVASAASARRISTSEQEFRITWARLTFAGPATSVTCAVSLLGSFHSRVSTKTIGALTGFITSASVGRCEEGTATALTADLPWHMAYNGFTGILPRISSVRSQLIGASWRVQAEVACLSRSDVAEPTGAIMNVNTSTGQVTQLRADETSEIDLEDTEFICDMVGNGTFSGTASVTTPAGGLIFVRLI